MTREEAMRLPKATVLKLVKADYEQHLDSVHLIELHHSAGKSGIANPACIKVVCEALVRELDRQIKEEESK